MPRPAKPRTPYALETGGWIAPLKLSCDAEEELLDLLHCAGKPLADRLRIVSSIEVVLGSYQPFTEMLDEAPRPAERAAELTPLFRSCLHALKLFRSLSTDAREDILNQASDAKHHARLCRFHLRLKEMTAGIRNAVRELKRIESRHGKTHRGLKYTIDGLALCFKEFYQPYEGEDRSDQQLDFIQSALEAANIKGNSHRTIRRKLQEPPLFS